MFEIGKKYNRQQDLHDKYGGNRQSGIAPCANNPYVFLFTSPRGEEYGYEDTWENESIFRYSSEGQYGDMELERGNLAIKNHKNDGRDLFLFNKVKSGEYEFIGKFEYISHEMKLGVDFDKVNRRTIVFKLHLVN